MAAARPPRAAPARAAAAGRALRGWRARVDAALVHPAAKPLVFAAALLPLAWLIYGAATDGLGANPAEALTRGTGDWTLRLLCLTLAVTPLRQWTGWHALARLRRMLGLFTFFYGVLHFLCYAWLDMGFDPMTIARDIPKRPFVLVGTLALLTMLPLAATSFNRAIRALGAARWRSLHRAVYAIAVLAILHFFWMRAGKNDFGEVAVYAAIVAGLLGWRAWRHWDTRGALASRRDQPMSPGSQVASGATSSTTNSATISATTNGHTPR